MNPITAQELNALIAKSTATNLQESSHCKHLLYPTQDIPYLIYIKKMNSTTSEGYNVYYRNPNRHEGKIAYDSQLNKIGYLKLN